MHYMHYGVSNLYIKSLTPPKKGLGFEKNEDEILK